jgi:inhibitor of KinA sporulation pathway (predicted exonuclease)
MPTVTPKPFVCVVDLESTCWQEGEKRLPDKEIIEIGAMLVDRAALSPLREFQTFVRPLRDPVLSEFCRSLTSITQEEVDRAPLIPEALSDFARWLPPPGECLFASWGAYDKAQLEQDCRQHGVPYPFDEEHLNLKRHFGDRKGRPPCGMKEALCVLGLPLEGAHHRAMDDVRNIVRILRIVGL